MTICHPSLQKPGGSLSPGSPPTAELPPDAAPPGKTIVKDLPQRLCLGSPPGGSTPPSPAPAGAPHRLQGLGSRR